MHGNYSPRPLHKKLNQKCTDGERGERRRKCPQIRDGNRQQRRNHDRPPPSQPLTPDTESPAPQDRPDVVDDGDRPGGVCIEAVLNPEKGWIEVLRSVTEEVES